MSKIKNIHEIMQIVNPDSDAVFWEDNQVRKVAKLYHAQFTQPITQDTRQRVGIEKIKEMLIYLYNCGYMNGHHHTVESQFTDIHRSDMKTYHDDVVDEIMTDEYPIETASLLLNVPLLTDTQSTIEQEGEYTWQDEFYRRMEADGYKRAEYIPEIKDSVDLVQEFIGLGYFKSQKPYETNGSIGTESWFNTTTPEIKNISQQGEQC